LKRFEVGTWHKKYSGTLGNETSKGGNFINFLVGEGRGASTP
jgi:hypothetical protein